MSKRDRLAALVRESAHSRTAVFAVLALLSGCGSAPDAPVTQYSSELALRGDERPEVRRKLGVGTWLVQVRERDIDVRAMIEAGAAKIELGESVPRHGIVNWVVSLPAETEVRVRLRSTDHSTWQGRAEVVIARFRRPADQPPAHAELGYMAWAQADEHHAAGTPQTWAIAADKLAEAISHFEEAGDDVARAAAAYSLAMLQYSARDEWSAAIRAAELAADLFDEVGDRTGMFNASVVRGVAEVGLAGSMNPATQRSEQKSLHDAAERRLAQAAQYFEQEGLWLRAAYTANLRGALALNVGDDDSAATHFAHALDLANSSADIAGQVRAKANLAWSRRLQGFVAQAAEQYGSLLPLLDPERQPYVYAAVLNNYGFCLIALGEFDRALALHTEALELFTRLGQQEERATQLAALGGLYFRAGDVHRALETLRAAIVAQESVSDSRGLAASLRVAGNAASVLGQHDIALEYLRRSTRIDANPHDVGRTRVLIAGELRSLGDYAAAETELAEALKSDVAVVRADATAERARLRMARDDRRRAIDDLRAADEAYASLGLDFNRIDTTASLAQALLAENDVAGAALAADMSVAIVQRIRIHSSNPQWRARFLSAQYAPFEARIAVDLAADDDTGIWKSFRTADEVRARSLADQMNLAPAGDRVRDADSEALRDRLTDMQLRLEARLQSPDADATGTHDLQREIAEVRAQLDARLTRSSPVSLRTGTLPPSLQALQQQLPGDSLVLAYFVGDRRSHAWLVGKERLQHRALPGREELQRYIDATSEHRPGTPGALAAELKLSSVLLGDLLAGAREQRLLVIPDGPLNGVPFAALPLDGTASQLMLDRFLIGYAPSLSLALSPAPAGSPAPQRVAVISDPVYAPDDRRFPAAGTGTMRGPRKASPNKLTRLPYSALEARAVIQNFGEQATISLAGFDATPDRVAALASSGLKVLHFATHAIARRDSPERSALFLSEYAPDGTLRTDSQLTTADVMRTGLKAELVVLSGCATGDGSMLRGEGVLGLTYGFLANGSSSVIASLWPVEDASTARFMNEFYRAYRASGHAAAALREAQQRSRANPGAAAVWSSFVVRANGFP
jgi:CHAT domain-containing protein/tetratricopeptide (TPR) repeat protein